LLLFRADGLWVGKWHVYKSTPKVVQYKYIVHDGKKIQDENYEWLGKTQDTGIVNRHLKIPGNCLVVWFFCLSDMASFDGSYIVQMNLVKLNK